MDTVKIGSFIKKLRTEKNMTQSELAEEIGSTYKTISRWENGNYMPPVEMMMELGKIFGITLNEILNGERVSESDYKQIAEKNMIEMKTENERKNLKVYQIAAMITMIIILVLFFILSFFSNNKLLEIVPCTVAFCYLVPLMVYYFSVARYSSKGERKLTAVILIFLLIATAGAFTWLILHITEIL